MMYGSLVWSNNWKEAKPLYKENTTRIIEHYPGAEIVEL
jgi:effector-binding domain-containing protein